MLLSFKVKFKDINPIFATSFTSVGIIFTCKSYDLMSCDSASANRVAEEVYPTL